MLRQLTALVPRLTTSGPGLLRHASAAPTVFDKIVQVNVLDKEGHVHVLRGLEGQTVVDVLQGHPDVVGEDVLATSPLFPDEQDAHVKASLAGGVPPGIPTELFSTFPAPDKDGQRMLDLVAAPFAVDIHSRLASSIKLSRATGDITISLADLAPWKTL